MRPLCTWNSLHPLRAASALSVKSRCYPYTMQVSALVPAVPSAFVFNPGESHTSKKKVARRVSVIAAKISAEGRSTSVMQTYKKRTNTKVGHVGPQPGSACAQSPNKKRGRRAVPVPQSSAALPPRTVACCWRQGCWVSTRGGGVVVALKKKLERHTALISRARFRETTMYVEFVSSTTSRFSAEC